MSDNRIVVPNYSKSVNLISNVEYATNEIHTTKYTIFTFIPRYLSEQLRRYAILYFLIIELLNWLPSMDAFAKGLQFLPLLFVFTLNATKDVFEDRRRYLADKLVNSNRCLIYEKNSEKLSDSNNYREAKWKDIRVGDIIQVSCNNVIPADILLLKTSDESGSCFIETANIDGETSLKQRQTISLFDKDYLDETCEFTVNCESPNNLIYRCDGHVLKKTKEKADRIVFNKHNMILRGCVLRNTDFVEGIVLYAGHETKVMLNNIGTRTKRSKLEKLINRDVLWLIILLLIFCFLGVIGHILWLNSFDYSIQNVFVVFNEEINPYIRPLLHFCSFVIVLQMIVPLSLYVSLEVIKLGQIYHISVQNDLYDESTEKRVECRALSIHEELGQIEYIFTDKTGTLTENNMLFKRCSINGRDYRHESSKSLTPNSLRAMKSLRSQRKSSLLTKFSLENPDLMSLLSLIALHERKEGKLIANQVLLRVENFFLTLALCNNVVVSKRQHNDHITEDENKTIPSNQQPSTEFSLFHVSDTQYYEAKSPDELALIEAAYHYKYVLLSRTPENASVSVPGGSEHEFKILKVLQFDSERKRMSVIVEHLVSKQKLLLCKGADSEIMQNLAAVKDEEEQKIIDVTKNHIYKYSQEGLRTLCIAKRELNETLFQEWFEEHKQCEKATEDRDKKLSESAKAIERDLELLGATGVEDTLQDGVPETIAALRAAGIIIWVITGDKQETAVNVAFACRLFSADVNLIYLKTMTFEETSKVLKFHLLEIQKCNEERKDTKQLMTHKLALVIDGQTLEHLIDTPLTRQFLELASQTNCVLVCRATPFQKGSIVKMVKAKLNVTALAIGDGANDVSMIRTADIGIGLSGQEGAQALTACDYTMPKFRYLERLLLVDGHWCYNRISKTALYFFYKNTSFVFVLFWYQFFCGFSTSVAIDQLYLLIYSLVITSIPPIVFGIYDQCASKETLVNKPRLYEMGRCSKVYNSFSFWLNMLDALYQSIIIFFIPYATYLNVEIGIYEFGTLLINSLTFVHSIHLAVEINSWTHLNTLAFSSTLIAFYVFVYYYNAISLKLKVLMHSAYVFQNTANNPIYWFTIALVTFTACLPRIIVNAVRNTVNPSEMFTSREEDCKAEQENALKDTILRTEQQKSTVYVNICKGILRRNEKKEITQQTSVN